MLKYWQDGLLKNGLSGFPQVNLLHKSNKLVITGVSGTGKSTYLQKYVLNSFGGEYKHVFVFDNECEFSYRLGVQPSRSVEELEKSVETGLTLFDPSTLFEGETPEAWDFFCEWVFQFAKQNLQTGPKLLVCDELQVITSTAQMPFETTLVVETGRRYQLDFAGIAQQLNLLHNRMRNQITELVSFRQEDSLVLDVLEKKGFDAEQIRALADGQFVWRNFQTGASGSGSIDLNPGKTAPEKRENSVDDTAQNDDDSANERPDDRV